MFITFEGPATCVSIPTGVQQLSYTKISARKLYNVCSLYTVGVQLPFKNDNLDDRFAFLHFGLTDLTIFLCYRQIIKLHFSYHTQGSSYPAKSKTKYSF